MVPLTPRLLRVLRDAVAKQPKAPTAPVAPSSKGTVWGESSLLHAFQRVLAKAKLPKSRLHDLRHTFASICDDRGVRVARVSAWMGHSTTTITMDTYQHLFRGDEDAVAIEELAAAVDENANRVFAIA